MSQNREWYGLNCVPPHLSKIHMMKSLTPNVLVFEDRAFGKQLGLEEVMRVGLHNGTKAFLKQDIRELLFLSVP